MDGRKNNGGNSTKSKGNDKRKNDFKKAINDAFSTSDVVEVLESLKATAIKDNDIQAAKVFLEYTAGKPTIQLEIDGGLEITSIPSINFTKSE